MLLNDAYGPLIQGFKINTTDRKHYYKNWINWRKNEFKPKDILDQSNLNLKQIEDYYKYLSFYVRQFDPLSNWYELSAIIKKSRKDKLQFKVY